MKIFVSYKVSLRFEQCLLLAVEEECEFQKNLCDGKKDQFTVVTSFAV